MKANRSVRRTTRPSASEELLSQRVLLLICQRRLFLARPGFAPRCGVCGVHRVCRVGSYVAAATHVWLRWRLEAAEGVVSILRSLLVVVLVVLLLVLLILLVA